MKNIIILYLFLLFSYTLASQESVVNKIMLGEAIEEENSLERFQSYNFAKLWTQAANKSVLGIIGESHKRLKIKLISVTKEEGQLKYIVYGKSCVDGNICDFNGIIKIKQIHQLKTLHFGVDDEFKEGGIKSQGIVIAEYNFEENLEQQHSGIFKGQLYSKWYINKRNEIEYDDIQFSSDGYLNNAFVGVWTSHNTKQSRICNWGDYRILNCNKDFDIGAAEFSPSEKYYAQGWENYQSAWLNNNKVAQKIELREWWK